MAVWRGVETGWTVEECWSVGERLWAIRPRWVFMSGEGYTWMRDCLTLIGTDGQVVPVPDLDVSPSLKTEGMISPKDTVMGVFSDDTTGLRLAQWAHLVTPGSALACAHNDATIAAFLAASLDFRQRETVGRLTWMERRA